MKCIRAIKNVLLDKKSGLVPNIFSDNDQKHSGNLLSLIRLVKYWNNRKVTLKIGSYMLECMIINRKSDGFFVFTTIV